MNERKLTGKQERFAQEYILCGNATAAYRSAYPVTKNWKSTSVGQQGDKSLKNPKIAARIKQLRSAMAKRAQIDQDRLTQEYARIAFLDFRIFFDDKGRLIPVDKLSDDAAAVLSGIETVMVGAGDNVNYVKKIKTYDKLKALGDLAKHLGFFKENNDQNKHALNITDNIPAPLREMMEFPHDAEDEEPA